MRKIDLSAVSDAHKNVAQSKPCVPRPEPVMMPGSLSKMGDPNFLWTYRMPNGDPYAAVARWDSPDGKQVRPIIWNGEEFVTSGFGNNRPLYNSDLLSQSPLSPVLIVEGEKSADAAVGYVPAGWIVVTWQGGANAWMHTDWSSLSGHPSVIWPDNDEAGIKAALGIRDHLQSLGISGAVAELPDVPNGWDLADELPDRITQQHIQSLLEQALYTAGQDEPPVRLLPLEWADQICPVLSRRWLIKDLLATTGIAVVFGHPAAGKSFLALDFACSVSLGWPWNGRKVEQGLVVYVAAEGAAGLRNRLAAFMAHHKVTDMMLAIIPTPIDLQDPKADTDRLIATIEAAVRQRGLTLALVVIDTLAKTFGAGKENTDDMAPYVANCERISSHFECCVLIVHHRPKDSDSREPRGHSSLKAGVDTVIIVEAGDPKTATVVKQKDGEDGARFAFRLQQVELGFDDEGEPVTSCVVEHVPSEWTAIGAGKTGHLKLTDIQHSVLHELRQSLKVDGVPVPDNIPDDLINRRMITKVVRLSTLTDNYLNSSASGADTTDKNPDTFRKRVQRTLDKLKITGKVGIWQGYVWEN